MLSVRRSVLRAPSLRRLPRHALPSLRLSAFRPPLSTSPPLLQLLHSQVRSFSQQSRQTAASRSLPDEQAAAEADAAVATLRSTGNLQLTHKEASDVLDTLVKQRRLRESVELLRFFQTTQKTPKAFALKTLFHELYSAKRYGKTLLAFDMMGEDFQLAASFYGKALAAATKLHQKEKVTAILQGLLLKEGHQVAAARLATMPDGVEGVVRPGAKLSKAVLKALLDFADRAGKGDVALRVLQLMQADGVALTSGNYDSILIACGQNDQLDEVMKVYGAMSEQLRSQLCGRALATVLRAHNQRGDEELVQRGLEIFAGHKDKWRISACNAALELLLQTRQFAEVLKLGDEMEYNQVKRSRDTYNAVVVALIRSGSHEQAKQLLQTNAKLMGKNPSRRVIDYYAKAVGDPVQTCQLALAMIQNGWRLYIQDYFHMLEMSIELPDHTTYWNIRRVLRLSFKYLGRELPDHLLLPEEITSSAAVVREHSGLSEEALEKFAKIRETDSTVSQNEASRLVVVMADHHNAKKCAEMLDFFKAQGVLLKPFARMSALTAFSRQKMFTRALQEFEVLRVAKIPLPASVYGQAMNAAQKLDNHETLTNIFRYLLEKEGGDEGAKLAKVSEEHEQATMHKGKYHVSSMVAHVREHGVKLEGFVLEGLVVYAGMSRQSDLARDVLDRMQEGGIEPTLDAYEGVLLACNADRRWDDVLVVYESMPAPMRMQLSGLPLGKVIKAHVENGDEDVMLRGLNIFSEHKAKWNVVACNAALDILLRTGQYEALLSLANDMASRELKITQTTRKMMVLAFIRSGALEDARQMLQSESARIRDVIESYRELIECYTATHGDGEAIHVCVEMIQTTQRMEFSDWKHALELALKAPEREIYWRVRKQLWLHGQAFESELPDDLLLVRQDDLRFPIAEGENELRPRQKSLDVSMALETFDDIRKANGVGLTKNVATRLLVAMIRHKRVDDCIEMSDYVSERAVTPKPVALLGLFSLLYEKQQFDKALGALKTMLNQGLVLDAGMSTNALEMAITLKQHALVTEILSHVKKHDLKLAKSKCKRIIGTLKEEEWETAREMLSAL